MEDTHWDIHIVALFGIALVLILVLMEDTHWAYEVLQTISFKISVLILVLMEDTHWDCSFL